MTLLKNKVSAEISVEIKLLKDLPDENFPLNLGTLILTLGKKNFILDSQQTNFKNNQKKGSKLTFTTSFGLDLTTFEVGPDNNYELEESDLKDKALKCEVYCSDDDAGIEKVFDFDNAKIQGKIVVDGKEHKIKVAFE